MQNDKATWENTEWYEEDLKKLVTNTKNTTKWKSYPDIFRIEAVIHDGQYYNIDKWSKMAGVSKEKVLEYIKEHKDILICKEQSYRVSYDEVIAWYKKNNLALHRPIVPNNFTPKLWGGVSEPEIYEDIAGRVPVTSLNIKIVGDIDMQALIDVCLQFGDVVKITDNSFLVCTGNAYYLREYLESKLSPKELEGIVMRPRLRYHMRIVGEIPEEILTPLIIFYKDYCFGILKKNIKTLNLFLPSMEEKESQIYEWIMLALTKFDNSKAVPFSGYLANVIERWVYDLPDIKFGKEFALFQRQLSKAERECIAKGKDSKDIESLYEYMEKDVYTFSEFKILYEEHLRWLGLTFTSSLPSERMGLALKSLRGAKDNTELSYRLGLAVIDFALKTEAYEEADKIISYIEEDSGELCNIELSDELKGIFYECCKENMVLSK